VGDATPLVVWSGVRMKLYADATPRFTLQLALDAAVACYVLFWIWLGTVVNDGVSALASPGEGIAANARDLGGSLSDAGGFLDDAPIIGDGIASPFDSAADASRGIAQASDNSVAAIERFGFWLGVVVAVVPIVYLLAKFLPGRIRFIRNVNAGQRLALGPADLEVFALRALTNQPLHRLARVSPDPAGGYRRGETDVITGLARLELTRIGLAVPESASTTGA